MIGFRQYCKEYRVGIWECPPFIFLLMGIITIIAILTTYFVGTTYTDPMWVVVIVCGVSIIFLILSYIILMSFERVASTSKQRSEFVGIMSHQLRGPLVSIKWQLSSRKRDEGINPGCEDAFLAIEEQNRKMIGIVNDLLEIYRLDDKTLIFMPSSFSLIKLVKVVVNECSKNTRGDVKLDLSFPEEDIILTVDKEKIKNIITHLVDNAYLYSPYGGKISIIVENVDKFVRFSVKDEGVGVSDVEKKHIFEKFFRGSNSKKYRTRGLGIGLYLAKSIIELMGGRVGFTSTEGSGSVFWFEIPLIVVVASENNGD